MRKLFVFRLGETLAFCGRSSTKNEFRKSDCVVCQYLDGHSMSSETEPFRCFKLASRVCGLKKAFAQTTHRRAVVVAALSTCLDTLSAECFLKKRRRRRRRSDLRYAGTIWPLMAIETSVGRRVTKQAFRQKKSPNKQIAGL